MNPGDTGPGLRRLLLVEVEQQAEGYVSTETHYFIPAILSMPTTPVGHGDALGD